MSNIITADALASKPDITLCSMNLLMKADEPQNDDGPWKFAGIASDESPDVEGDAIFKKALDLTYAQKRGYVNWDHGRDPGDQIGFLTKATIIDDTLLAQLNKDFNQSLSKTASIYVEGELYKNVHKAKDVRAVMKSLAPGEGQTLGLSIEGVMARTEDDDIVKAFVRGMAFTPAPAHTKTLVQMRKNLAMFNVEPELAAYDPHTHVETEVIQEVIAYDASFLGLGEAILSIGNRRPNWSFELVKRVATFLMQHHHTDTAVSEVN